jgi:23S rRNA (uracil1939-C5)-methyltransferase
MVGRETLRIDGRAQVRERIGEVSYLVSPTAFFQTNVTAAAAIIDIVLSHAPAQPALQIADLYSGSGLFSLPLAARGHRVTAVEESQQAVADGDANARLNRLNDRVRFVGGRVEDTLKRLARTRFDLVVMDPPRSGCPPAVIEQLFGEIKPAAAVYVSCNPERLAEELPAIVEHGYAVRRVQPVDMFPHTTHIETVVSLAAERP